MKTVMSDIEIAQKHKIKNIEKIAKNAGIPEEFLELYGNKKAKINFDYYETLKNNKDGNLILVTAITPTKAGEGKTTTTIGLGDALSLLDKKTMICLREPSMGPVFGLKGGATGGGYSQVIPMEDINLHFTGDMHAITSANNLISAVLDNHIYQGNELNINPERVMWKRALDMNDRTLRNITIGIGKNNGVQRQDSFNITVASEIMAIMCLSKDISDFKSRVDRCIVAYSNENLPITVKDLKITGSVALLMRDALKPNLVQTLGATPTLIHGGPFANIAHGSNSIIATKMALKMADYVVTEAGFGADLGAEKFLNIKSQEAGLNPKMVVIVASVRALKMHGGVEKNNLTRANTIALLKGVENLAKHIENIQLFNVPYVIAINRFPDDTKKEIDALLEWCKSNKHNAFVSNVYTKGGKGALDLADYIVKNINPKTKYIPLYNRLEDLEFKIKKIATKIYGAKDVVFLEQAIQDLKRIKQNGYNQAYICMAKTPNSLSDDDKALGRPKDFTLTIREIRLSAGANLVIPVTGTIMSMPGLPKNPAAERIDILPDGTIEGLF
jgi:formate--tetrahydrofolate ligase